VSAKTFRSTDVTRAIGDPRLNLIGGNGYWYFVFDDIPTGLYDTHSVYVMRLRDMTLERWIEEGTDFVDKMKKRPPPTKRKGPLKL
jgi:hypothetical protein